MVKNVPKKIRWHHYVLSSELVTRMKKVVPNGTNPSARYRSLHQFVIETVEKRVEELEKLKERKRL